MSLFGKLFGKSFSKLFGATAVVEVPIDTRPPSVQVIAYNRVPTVIGHTYYPGRLLRKRDPA